MSEDHEYHAVISPSGSHKWLVCAGSIAMESLIENQSSEFADEGTAAHTVASLCLEAEIQADTYIGQKLTVGQRTFKVDDGMAGYVQTYIDQIRGYVEEYKLRGAVEVEMYVEQQVPIGHITGEKDARGTSDAIIIAVWEDGSATIVVSDLKYGRGIEVEADDNPQLKLYALGAVEKFGLLYDFKDVRLTIHQPRIKTAPSEWECSIDHLMAFSKFASQKADHALTVLNQEMPGAWTHHLVAGDHCKKAFCRARGNCMKLDQFVADSIGADFDVIASLSKDAVVQMVKGLPITSPEGAYEIGSALLADTPPDADCVVRVSTPEGDGTSVFAQQWEATRGEGAFILSPRIPPTLSDKMAVLDIIDDWIKAVRGRVEYELLHGNEVPGYKLVQGKQGNRSWKDAEEAEAKLKSMRLKKEEMYNYTLISPTNAEKLLKDTPKRWASLQENIGRSPGQPSVAPVSDKRPALVIKPVADDFETVDDGSDLA